MKGRKRKKKVIRGPKSKQDPLPYITFNNFKIMPYTLTRKKYIWMKIIFHNEEKICEWKSYRYNNLSYNVLVEEKNHCINSCIGYFLHGFGVHFMKIHIKTKDSHGNSKNAGGRLFSFWWKTNIFIFTFIH